MERRGDSYVLKLARLRKVCNPGDGPWGREDDEKWTAYAEGFHAGQWGDPKGSNPYTDPPLRRAWRRGWNEATKGNE